MGFKDSIWFIFYLPYFAILGIFVGIAWTTSCYIDLIPTGNENSVIGAFLTGSSILFGFAALSTRGFLDRIVDLNQNSSDVAKELCDTYRMVKADPKLSSKKLSYKTKIRDYGRKSAFGYSGEAPKVIEVAYDFVSNTFRWWINLYKTIIYFAQVTPLLVLGSSIILALLSYAPALMEFTLSPAIISFMLAVPIILVGWYFSNKTLVILEDTLFNVRYQISGKIAGILPER